MRTTPKMGLFSWDQLGDDYNYAQLAQNFQTIDYHDHSAGRGPQIPAGGLAPGAVLSSNVAANAIGAQHFALSTLQNLGLNQPGSNGRGYVSIPASQSTGSTTYTTLTTPDQVNNVTTTPGGLIVVAYQATWFSSGANNGSATICLNGTPVVIATNGGTPLGIAVSGTPNTNAAVLSTTSYGLTTPGVNATPWAGDVTTGQVVGYSTGGGPCSIFAAPGTYNVSVQYKASSGTVTALNRKLWVWTRNFN